MCETTDGFDLDVLLTFDGVNNMLCAELVFRANGQPITAGNSIVYTFVDPPTYTFFEDDVQFAEITSGSSPVCVDISQFGDDCLANFRVEVEYEADNIDVDDTLGSIPEPLTFSDTISGNLTFHQTIDTVIMYNGDIGGSVELLASPSIGAPDGHLEINGQAFMQGNLDGHIEGTFINGTGITNCSGAPLLVDSAIEIRTTTGIVSNSNIITVTGDGEITVISGTFNNQQFGTVNFGTGTDLTINDATPDSSLNNFGLINFTSATFTNNDLVTGREAGMFNLDEPSVLSNSGTGDISLYESSVLSATTGNSKTNDGIINLYHNSELIVTAGVAVSQFTNTNAINAFQNASITVAGHLANDGDPVGILATMIFNGNSYLALTSSDGLFTNEDTVLTLNENSSINLGASDNTLSATTININDHANLNVYRASTDLLDLPATFNSVGALTQDIIIDGSGRLNIYNDSMVDIDTNGTGTLNMMLQGRANVFPDATLSIDTLVVTGSNSPQGFGVFNVGGVATQLTPARLDLDGMTYGKTVGTGGNPYDTDDLLFGGLVGTLTAITPNAPPQPPQTGTGEITVPSDFVMPGTLDTADFSYSTWPPNSEDRLFFLGTGTLEIDGTLETLPASNTPDPDTLSIQPGHLTFFDRMDPPPAPECTFDNQCYIIDNSIIASRGICYFDSSQFTVDDTNITINDPVNITPNQPPTYEWAYNCLRIPDNTAMIPLRGNGIYEVSFNGTCTTGDNAGNDVIVVAITEVTTSTPATYIKITDNFGHLHGIIAGVEPNATSLTAELIGGLAPFAYRWTINGATSSITKSTGLTGVAPGAIITISILDICNRCFRCQTFIFECEVACPCTPIG